MKLTELNPRWVIGDRYDTQDGTQHFDLSGRHGMGISFKCPVHKEHRLVVFFENPLDGLPAQYGKNLWKRDGNSFDTITLTPSIDASGNVMWPDCWHGFIKHGDVV